MFNYICLMKTRFTGGHETIPTFSLVWYMYIGKHLNTKKNCGDSLREDTFVEIAFSGGGYDRSIGNFPW